ncbi:MAG TPA: hypothetical protein VFH04_00645, partial [Nitrososphaeraceae archaeon]|nr:hypothetical protein [Nitrososphaeraceae archaeon]
VIVKSDGFALPPPSLITRFVTIIVPGCGSLLVVSFDESGVGAKVESEDRDVGEEVRSASIRFLSLCSLLSDVGKDIDEIFSLLLDFA